MKFETLIQALADKIKFSAVNVRKAFGVYQNLHAMVFKDHVFGGHFVYVFKLVGQTRAARGFDA
jgi:hypothetical protein